MRTPILKAPKSKILFWLLKWQHRWVWRPRYHVYIKISSYLASQRALNSVLWFYVIPFLTISTIKKIWHRQNFLQDNSTNTLSWWEVCPEYSSLLCPGVNFHLSHSVQPATRGGEIWREDWDWCHSEFKQIRSPYSSFITQNDIIHVINNPKITLFYYLLRSAADQGFLKSVLKLSK